MSLKTKLQLKVIKASCRAMTDMKLLELYTLVINQEDKTEKEYPEILEIIKTEMTNRGLIP